MISPTAHLNRNGNSNASASASALAPASTTEKPTGSLDTISDIKRRFESAILNSWSRRAPTYSIVDVMLLSWGDDEAELKTSLSSLEAAFRNSLNYTTEVCTIRSTGTSHDDIHAKVEYFFSKDKSLDRLAIFYFAGRCVPGNTSDGQSLFLVPYVTIKFFFFF